ncbi:hypothetical protein D9M73_68970 [compost metagenome]
MHIFELDQPTKVKFTDVEVLSSKDRKPNENPGAALNVTMVVGNDMLSMFDGYLKSAMYMAVPKGTKVPEPPEQAQGDMVPPAKVVNAQIVSDMPKLTNLGIKLGEFAWELESIGYLLHIEYGASGPNGITFKGCKVYRYRLFGQEGGSVIVKYRIEFGDVDSIAHGKLAMLKNCEAVITLTAPVVAGEEDKSNPLPFEKDGSKNPAAGGNVTPLKGGKTQQAAKGAGADDEEPMSPEAAFAASQASK